MWICQRCHSENRDTAAACEACGAVRAAGRFGSAPQRPHHAAQPPRVAPPAQAQEPEMPASSTRGAYPPPDPFGGKPRRRRSPLNRLAKLTGALLCVLLPGLTLALAIVQREALMNALSPLIVQADGPNWLSWLVFGAFSLAGVLLALLPGLWTLLLTRKRD